MLVNIKVVHTKDFVKTTVTGVLDFAVSKQALLVRIFTDFEEASPGL
jgi:hypothetical protein